MKQPALINTNGMSSAREMRRLKKERLIKEAGLQRIMPPNLHRNEPHAESAELHFRDEDRSYPVSFGSPCPGCGLRISIRMQVRHEPGKKFFSMKCTNDACEFVTPEFPSSDLAKRHWKLVAALSK